MAKGDDIEERLIEFAVTVVRLCASLPESQAGKHISGQLLRSGTAPAAHYAEAHGAESTKDFIHKLRICLKELRETYRWLKLIQRVPLLRNNSLLDELLQESEELIKIFVTSIKTAIKKMKQ